MSIQQIRSDFRDVIAGVAGINEALAYPPDALGSVPLAYLGDAVAAITNGMSQEIQDWTLPLTVVVARKAIYGQELQATETLIGDLLTVIRANYTLGGTTFGLHLTGIREGQLKIADQPVVGFTMTFQVKFKMAVSYSG